MQVSLNLIGDRMEARSTSCRKEKDTMKNLMQSQSVKSPRFLSKVYLNLRFGQGKMLNPTLVAITNRFQLEMLSLMQQLNLLTLSPAEHQRKFIVVRS